MSLEDPDVVVQLTRLSRTLHAQRSDDETWRQLVAMVQQIVPAGDDVSLSARVDGQRIETRSVMWGTVAEPADRLQAEHWEGPLLDAGPQRPVVRCDDLAETDRWPRWSAAVVEQLGVRSVLCVHLYTHSGRDLGALQVFAQRPHAFDEHAEATLAAVGAHAAVALDALAEHTAMEQALGRRATLGQATGILMERYGWEAEVAFGMLRRTSRESNRRLFDLASDVVAGEHPSGL